MDVEVSICITLHGRTMTLALLFLPVFGWGGGARKRNPATKPVIMVIDMTLPDGEDKAY